MVAADRSAAGWTVATLKEHFDMRYDELQKAMLAANAANKEAVASALQAVKEAGAAALAAADRAVAKSEAASDARFQNVNEFRQSLNDFASRLIPREEANARIDSLTEKIDAAAMRLTTIEGRSSGMNQYWIWIVGGIAALGALLAISSRVSAPAPVAPAPIYVMPQQAGQGSTTTSQTTSRETPQ